MNVELPAVEWQLALVDLDNIVVISRSASEHIHHDKHVLTLSRDAGVALMLKKWSLFMKSIKYFGHAIRPRRSEITLLTKNATAGLKDPRNVKEIKIVFLSF